MSPAPQTSRGRTTTVSKPSPFASRTACSAIAFVGGVERLRVGPQRRGLVDVHERLAGDQRRLGADVDEAAHAGLAAGRAARSRVPVDVAALELLPRAPLAEVGGERGRRRSQPRGAGAHRGGVVEVAAHRLGAERARPSRPTRRERASARTRQPSPTSRRISAPPMKPEPPVTKTSVRSLTPRSLDVAGVAELRRTPSQGPVAHHSERDQDYPRERRGRSRDWGVDPGRYLVPIQIYPARGGSNQLLA